jgi:hypothetical protein
MTTRLAVGGASALVIACLLGLPASAQMQMPDPSQMSGVPLPSADLPIGTVTVRVVRGNVSNVIPDQPVELHGGPSVLQGKTDADGRATFSSLAPGTSVHALTIVDGQRLESQEFPVPAQGGVRVMLVAPDAASAARGAESAKLAAAPPQPGVVILSGQSQFVVEVNDDELEVFYILRVANNARTPVETDPLVFDLPRGARSASLLEGPSSLASVNGSRLTITGPFPPGPSLVQVAYQMPYEGGEVTIAQPLPATLEALSIVAAKVGDMHLSSPQMTNHGEMPAQGKTYLVAAGPAIRAGDTLTFTITGLPHRAAWPRAVALVLAVLILAAGAWASVSLGGDAAAAASRRRQLHERRDRLFGDLVRIEEEHRAGRLDDQHYAVRRRDLVAQLERLYGELDGGLAA